MNVLSPRRAGLPWPKSLPLWMQTFACFDQNCHNLPLTPSNESSRNGLKHGNCVWGETAFGKETEGWKCCWRWKQEVAQAAGRALWEAGQSNWPEWTVIFSPVGNMNVSTGVMYSLSAEATFLMVSLLVNRRNNSCLKILPISFNKICGTCWNKRKVN